ncbi:hypothetical protein F8M41_012200 [Gigaspora margarita]|uniref:Uncharacterized protein n=1 Tax=Gigaspora margarita TaxID=4874 RepID=A0A8H4EPV6_GIGMA|nr:hypothetical protein F8M41_012200 [Gigaspora margarita]
MSASISQIGDVIIEVKNEEIGPENEDKKRNRSPPDKYLAVSPEDFELQMYDIKISNNKDDSKQKSYRELSKIHTTFKFTNGQVNLSKDKDVHKNVIRWSVSVSDKSTSSSEFRLLAISYISLKDMEYYKENFNKIHPMQIPNHGFTFVFHYQDY